MLFCDWFIFTGWSFLSLQKYNEMLPLFLEFHSCTKLLESCRIFCKFQGFFSCFYSLFNPPEFPKLLSINRSEARDDCTHFSRDSV